MIEATTREPDAIRLHSLDLHVVIRGLHAETTATMIVSNSSPRDAEARVLFPLPPEAVVSGFSLKVGDRMVDGVVVERGQARVAFEGEMSKRVDPGIAEWTEDGSCRCRIFPVPPNGARTFAVTSLAPAAFEGDEAVFRLPLPVGTTLERLHISVEAADTGQDPRWTGFGGLVLTKEGTAYRGELNLLHVTPESGASIRIPRVPPRVVEVEQSQGEHYLFVSEAAPNRQLRGPGAPGKIAIGWDASGSRSSDSVERDLRFLKDLAATWKHTDVRVVVFRDRPEQPRRFSIRDGDAGELLSLLAGAPCDGGTDLGALDFSRLPGDTDTPDLWLLFTDGKATLDSGLPTLGDVPVIVVSSDRQRNSAVLRRIASVTGGAFLDLTSPVAGDGLTGLAPLRVDIQAPAGALSDIRHSYDPLSGRVTVVARLRADCKVSLVYWQFGKEVGRATIAARLSGGVPGSNLRLHWAAGRAEDLFVTSGKSTDELLELARSHGIVTGASSLIVLENIAQYLRYKITPPETWPELRAEYLEKRRQWPDGPAPPGETVVKPPRRPISFEEVRSWFSNSIEGAVSDLWKRTVHTPEGSGGSAAIHETAREGGESKRFRRGGREERLGPHFLDAGHPGNPCRTCHDFLHSGTAPLRGASGATPPQQAPRVASPALPARNAGVEAAAIEADSRAVAPSATIAIIPDNGEQSSLRDIEGRPAKEGYAAYLEQRPPFQKSPVFYLESALRLFPLDPVLGSRILSNLQEFGFTDPALLRSLAWCYRAVGDLDMAVATMEKLPPDSWSHFELAWMLAERMQLTGHAADGERAAELYAGVMSGQPRDLLPVALEELNRLLDVLESSGKDAARWRELLDEKLRMRFDAGLRVVLTWTEYRNVDLPIDGPPGTRNGLCFGSQQSGVRECIIPDAPAGDYRVRVSFSSYHSPIGSRPRLFAGTIYTNYGRPGEEGKPFFHLVDEAVDNGTVVVGQVSLGAASVSSPGKGWALDTLIPVGVRPLFCGSAGAGLLSPYEDYRCDGILRPPGEGRIRQERRREPPPRERDPWGAYSPSGWGPLSSGCYLCHNAGSESDLSDKAYAPSGHQYESVRIPQLPSGFPDRSLVNPGLRYTSSYSYSIECTSCHNVHVPFKPPFMQVGSESGDFSSLCRTCHAGRSNRGKVGRENILDPAPFGASYSTHPTDVPVANIAGNGPTAFGPVDPRLTVTVAPGAPWQLGGKLADPASADAARTPFSCQTCHVVHGPAERPDEELPGLLAIWNQADPSALCTGCHAGSHPEVAFADWKKVHHPMGDDPGTAFYPDRFASRRGVPAAWFSRLHGDSGAAGFDPCAQEQPSCVSCHDVHGGLPWTSLLFGPNPVDGGGGDWCYSCHPEESLRGYRFAR